jgi:hypothetical protein
MRPRTGPCLLLLTTLWLAGGCASVHSMLPWADRPAPAPDPVRELVVTVPPETQTPIVLQFWERNTLIVDLTGVASAGSIALEPGPSGRWPARLAVRVLPGRVEALELRGAQRSVHPVTPDRSGPVTITVSPRVHPPAGTPLRVSWGQAGTF